MRRSKPRSAMPSSSMNWAARRFKRCSSAEVGVRPKRIRAEPDRRRAGQRRAVAVAGDVGDVEQPACGQQAGGVEPPPLARTGWRRAAVSAFEDAGSRTALALGGVLVRVGPPVLVALGDRAVEHLESRAPARLDDLRVTLRATPAKTWPPRRLRSSGPRGRWRSTWRSRRELVAEPLALARSLDQAGRLSMKRIAHGVTLSGDRARAARRSRGSGTPPRRRCSRWSERYFETSAWAGGSAH